MVGDAEPHRLRVECYAKVADVANESGWQFRRCRDPNLQKIILSISGVQPPIDGSAEDKVLWRSRTDLYDCRVSRNPHRFSLGGGRFKWSGGVIWSTTLPPFSAARVITLSRRFEKSRFQGPLLHSVQNGTLSPPVEGNYYDDDPALCLTMWQSVAVRFCFSDVASLGSSMSVYSSRDQHLRIQKVVLFSA
ncbi:hypothetical protein YC2023_023876 [Brassica napus]